MELLEVGYFSKTHGVKGHLILRTEMAILLEDLKALFIEASSGKAPYFIEEIKDSNTGIILRLEEVDTVEKAKPLLGKKVFIDASLVEEEEADFEWLGYELIDEAKGFLGIVNGVTNNGHQVLLSIPFRGKEVILPLVEDFVQRIDEKEKKLYYNAPEGLIDLYLEEAE